MQVTFFKELALMISLLFNISEWFVFNSVMNTKDHIE